MEESQSVRPPARQVRAVYDDETITVYQAYAPAIAVPAIAAQTLVPPFKPGRMTWIKPSFLWMMYRSGWATKAGQERVLAIRISRAGFERALTCAALSHYQEGVYSSREEWKAHLAAAPVRVQWDPERDIQLNELPWRSIQVGLSGSTAASYVNEWITEIVDFTDRVHELHASVVGGRLDSARARLPVERAYPLPHALARNVGATLDSHDHLPDTNSTDAAPATVKSQASGSRGAGQPSTTASTRPPS